MAIKSVELVCMANYCRSPVAEKILDSLNLENISFSSSGIRPYPSASMDKRSYEYISNLGISNKSHIPRKITSEIVQATDLVLAMDLRVLTVLNKKYKNQQNKIKLFSYCSSDIDVSDPFRMDEKNYYEIMDNIKFLCENFSDRFKI